MALPPDAIALNNNQQTQNGLPSDAIPLNNQSANSAPISQNPNAVSPMDYWVNNPAKSAMGAYVNDAKDIGNAITHPVDTAVSAAKGLGSVLANPYGAVVNAVQGIPNMVMNHPLQTVAMALPFAEGAGKLIAPPSSDELIQKAIPDYAKIINPGTSISRNFLQEHKDINDVYGTLADNGVIIKKSQSSIPGMAPKSDNSFGISQLDNALAPERQNQQQLLSKFNSNVPGNGGTDIDAFAQKAKANLLTDPLTKNDPSLQSDISALMNKRFTDIKNNSQFGKYVNPQQLNNLKTGWQNIGWEIGNNNDAIMGKILGSTARSEIKDNLNNLNSGLGDQLDQSNAKMAKLLEAKGVLQMTHNNSISTNLRNPISSKVIPSIGLGVGAVTGNALKVGGEFGGPVGGGALGGKLGSMWAKSIKEKANDPETITGNWAKQIQAAKLRENPPMPSQNSVMRPQQPTQQPMQQAPVAQQPVPQPQMNQSPIMQPTPQQVKQFGTPNAPRPMQGGQGTMSGSQNPIHNMPPEALKNLEKQIKIEKIIRS